MKAVTIEPGRAGSLQLDNVGEPARAEGDVLVQTLSVGVCGTDRELIDAHFGEAPAGRRRLVLGHESLGRVLEAPPASGLAAGDLVVGIVRCPDPVPCANCAAGEWDMCSNGRYVEHGIKGLDGFARERFRMEAARLVKVERSLGQAAVLLEPASVLAKAWEQIERIGARALWRPKRVLVTGAGPVGLFAALMGVQRGLEVHVQDHNEDGPKADLVRALAAKYSSRPAEGDFDIVLECTGAVPVVKQVLELATPNRIVCLAGLTGGASDIRLAVAPFNQSLVLGNGVVFGSVNANRRHYQAAAQALARADRAWLERLVTRRVPVEAFEQAYERQPGDVKTVLALAD